MAAVPAQDYEAMTLHVRLAGDVASFIPLLRGETPALDGQITASTQEDIVPFTELLGSLVKARIAA